MDTGTKEWFEMHDVKKRFFNKSVWIPLKFHKALLKDGVSGHLNFKEEYFGVGSILVPLEKRAEAEELDWQEIGLRSSNGGYVENGEYVPAQIYKTWGEDFRAEYPIIESRGNSIECAQWYLNPDIISTLNLKQEGDVWVAIQYGYEEVVRMERNENGCVIGLSIKANYLKDYLKARQMALYMTSYRSRTEIYATAPEFNWPDPHTIEEAGDRWEGRIMEIHEGGHPFGSKFAVMHLSRTDVDFEEDVPEFEFASDEVTKMDRWEGGYDGQKFYRIQGELWRCEWVEPAEKSLIILEEETEPSVFFVTDNSGKTESRKTLVNGSRWLWFRPSVVNAILSTRGSSLSWYTRDTGSIECSPGHGLHFGVNSIGLVNVFAKDIGLLPDWQQKIWAAHNVPPEGKVSSELLQSQMEAKPASTQAPEEFIQRGIDLINEFALSKYGIQLINEHPEVESILLKVHRFRATSKEGLLELAKDLYRLFGERINTSDIKSIVKPTKEEKWGQLKAIERLLSTEVGEEMAYKVMGAMWGVYSFRNTDSHLPSSTELSEAYELARIDSTKSYVLQGLDMLNSYVTCLYTICEVLNPDEARKRRQ